MRALAPGGEAVGMFSSLTERQKGVTYYLLTLAMAILVATFGPTGGPGEADRLQILNMLTATAGVLLMLLVVTRDGYRRAGWAQLALHRAGWRYWPLALPAPAAILAASYAAVGNRLIVVPMFLAVLTGAGVLYGYLRDRSDSTWPAVLAHGTFNAVLGVLAGAAVSVDPLRTAYLTGESGVFTLAAVIVMAWVLTVRGRSETGKQEPQQRPRAQSQPGSRPAVL
jgi:hypothetical protein